MAKGVTARIKEAAAETVDRATHLDVAGATQAIAKKFGLNQRLINYTHIELRNKLNEYGFKETPYNQRVLFLPHCLRNSKECKAKSTDEGLQCRRCGKCNIAELLTIADELGYQGAFVVPGGSMMQKIIKKQKPKATVGVCCYHEANLAFDFLRGTGIHAQVALLLQDGCKDTRANVAEAREKMELIGKNVLEGNSKELKK
ncbi:MAG: DUF116 domain-containing protein [archaeon]